MSAPARNLPAFGRAVIDARRRGEPINLFIYCGTRCWQMARARDHALAIPTFNEVERIDWRPIVSGLAGVTVVARDCPAGGVDRFSRSLIQAGAKLVASIQVQEGEIPRIHSDFYRLVRK